MQCENPFDMKQSGGASKKADKGVTAKTRRSKDDGEGAAATGKKEKNMVTWRETVQSYLSVSYTHLTLPTNREV